ncbi:MAG: response regulator [Acidobacteria bacterium]|nr:response regulator [Acidobacteriota bacterium]
MTHDTNAESSRRSTLLAVGGRSDDFRSLRTILEAGDWNVREAASYDEAANLMEDGPPAVIACDAELPDGDWKDLFHLAAALENPPPVVVVSRHADERLWAEVLNAGGYDLLARPFESAEVLRVMDMASRHGRTSAAAG